MTFKATDRLLALYMYTISWCTCFSKPAKLPEVPVYCHCYIRSYGFIDKFFSQAKWILWQVCLC